MRQIAAGHPRQILFAGPPAARLPAPPKSISNDDRVGSPPAVAAPTTADGSHRVRMSGLPGALRRRAPLFIVSAVLPSGRTRRSLSGVRPANLALRSARVRDRTTPEQSTTCLSGCGHAALLAQSLDNRCAVTHMTTLQHYDGTPLRCFLGD